MKIIIKNNYNYEINESDILRFWAKVDTDVSRPDDCWNWLASKNDQGYGNFKLGPKKLNYNSKAHRISYILKTKKDIDNNLFILHSCDNPSCVNPKHLFLGTNLDNMQDMAKKGRALDGVKSPRAKLTENNIKEIRKIKESTNFTNQEIADRFSVSRGQISKIINFKQRKRA